MHANLRYVRGNMYENKDVCEVVKLAQLGDEEAKEYLINKNSPLIKYITFINQIEQTKQYNIFKDVRYLTKLENDTLKIFKAQQVGVNGLAGNGVFGVVMKGKMIYEKRIIEVAIKETQQCYSDSLIRETTILQHCKHPNLVRLYGYCKYNQSLSINCIENNVINPNQNNALKQYYETLLQKQTRETTYMIMEYCNGGNLYDYLNKCFTNKKFHFDYNMKLKICRDIRNSQEYLYECQFIHRDIKLENFLVSFENNQIIVKCCDFGQTRSKDRIMVTKCGTPLYVDHNRYQGKVYSDKSDLYSIGVCFYYIATGKFPQRTSNNN